VYGGKLVNTGMRSNDIPFFERAAEPAYLVFASQQITNYGWPKVRAIAHKAGFEFVVIKGLRGMAKWRAIGQATALLHPSAISAAPRVIVEAAYCGTPALVLNCDGAQHHVRAGVTGFVGSNINTLHKLASQLHQLERKSVRAFAEQQHSFDIMISKYEQLLERVAAGEVW
jgi:glycosyltransferase involved in cell wall biosynthesis